MRVTLVPAGHPGGAADLVAAVAGLETVWFVGHPGRADEVGVAAAALAASTTLRVGVPVLPGDNAFWAARRIGTLAWAAAGRVLDVLFVVDDPADEPAVLATLLLLRQVWSDPAFAELVQVRPAGTAAAVRAVVVGRAAAAIAVPLRLPWLVPAADGPPVTGGLTDDDTEAEVSWLTPATAA